MTLPKPNNNCIALHSDSFADCINIFLRDFDDIDSAILISVKRDENKKFQITSDWIGDPTICLGAIEILKRKILHSDYIG